MSAVSSASKTQKPKKNDAPEEPILSGRLMIAFVIILTLVGVPLSPLGRMITKKSPKTTIASAWKVGESARVNLTVVTADFERLACAADQQLEKDRCGFDSAGHEVAAHPAGGVKNNHLHQLQPYRSTDGQLLLIPGLWAQPPVARRLHEAPSMR